MNKIQIENIESEEAKFFWLVRGAGWQSIIASPKRLLPDDVCQQVLRQKIKRGDHFSLGMLLEIIPLNPSEPGYIAASMVLALMGDREGAALLEMSPEEGKK